MSQTRLLYRLQAKAVPARLLAVFATVAPEGSTTNGCCPSTIVSPGLPPDSGATKHERSTMFGLGIFELLIVAMICLVPVVTVVAVVSIVVLTQKRR
jgi:hypothetical protein